MQSMNLDLYRSAMRRKKVPLSIAAYLQLWFYPAFGFGLPIYFGFHDGLDKLHNPGSVLVVALLWGLATYNIYTIFRDTRFIFVASKKSLPEKHEVLMELQRKLRWSLDAESLQYFKFEDRTTLLKWSNYITIVWNEDGYFINCLDERYKKVTLFSNPWKRFEEVADQIYFLERNAQTTNA